MSSMYEITNNIFVTKTKLLKLEVLYYSDNWLSEKTLGIAQFQPAHKIPPE